MGSALATRDLPDGVRSELDRVSSALRAVARSGETSPSRGRDGRAHAALLAEFDRAIGALTALRGELLVAARDSGAWQGSGDPSFEAWRGRTSRAGSRAAAAQVRQAQTATQMPLMRSAVQEGQVTVDHLDALSRVVSSAPPPVRQAMAAPDTQAELVLAARRLDASTFARSAARMAASLAPAAHERGHQLQRAARHLHVVDVPEGTKISGLLDSAAGHRLRLALESASPRPAQDDERTPEQRRADALLAIAEKVLTLPETMSGAAVRPHVSFHLTAETWAQVRAARAARAASSGADGVGPVEAGAADVRSGGVGSAAASLLPIEPVEPVTLDDGTPVPPSEVARALCDCELTRIVVDAEGAVLDLGRTQRTYTGAQRRAVLARDRGCGWPTCPAEARWGEVHHVRWWDRDGGATSVENGVLLCSYHHHEVHRRELDIRRVRGGPGGVAGAGYEFRDPSGRVVSPVRAPAPLHAADDPLEPARDADAVGAAVSEPAASLGTWTS